MAKAIVDPEELRRFAAFLDSERERLQSQRSSMRVEFARLHEDWQDAKYTQFAQTYEEAERALQKYLEYCETYAAFLRKKAAKAEQIQDFRYPG